MADNTENVTTTTATPAPPAFRPEQIDAMWQEFYNTPNPAIPDLKKRMANDFAKMKDPNERLDYLKQVMEYSKEHVIKTRDRAAFDYYKQMKGSISKYRQGYVPPPEGADKFTTKMTGTTMDTQTGAVNTGPMDVPDAHWTPEQQRAQARNVAESRQQAMAAGRLEPTPLRMEAAGRLSKLGEEPQQRSFLGQVGDIAAVTADSAVAGTPVGMFAHTPGARAALLMQLAGATTGGGIAPGLVDPTIGMAADEKMAGARYRAETNPNALMRNIGVAGEMAGETLGGAMGYGAVGKGVNVAVKGAESLPIVGKAVAKYGAAATNLMTKGKEARVATEAAKPGLKGLFNVKGNVGALAQAGGEIMHALPTMGAIGAGGTAGALMEGQPLSEAASPNMMNINPFNTIPQAFGGEGWGPEINVPSAVAMPLLGQGREWAPKNKLVGGPMRAAADAFNLDWSHRRTPPAPPGAPGAPGEGGKPVDPNAPAGEAPSAAGVKVTPVMINDMLRKGPSRTENVKISSDLTDESTSNAEAVLEGRVPLQDVVNHPSELTTDIDQTNLKFGELTPSELEEAGKFLSAKAAKGELGEEGLLTNCFVATYLHVRNQFKPNNKSPLRAVDASTWANSPDAPLIQQWLREKAQETNPDGTPTDAAKTAMLNMEAARQSRVRARDAEDVKAAKEAEKGGAKGAAKTGGAKPPPSERLKSIWNNKAELSLKAKDFYKRVLSKMLPDESNPRYVEQKAFYDAMTARIAELGGTTAAKTPAVKSTQTEATPTEQAAEPSIVADAGEVEGAMPPTEPTATSTKTITIENRPTPGEQGERVQVDQEALQREIKDRESTRAATRVAKATSARSDQHDSEVTRDQQEVIPDKGVHKPTPDEAAEAERAKHAEVLDANYVPSRHGKIKEIDAQIAALKASNDPGRGKAITELGAKRRKLQKEIERHPTALDAANRAVNNAREKAARSGAEDRAGWEDMTDMDEPLESWRNRLVTKKRKHIRAIKGWLQQFKQAIVDKSTTLPPSEADLKQAEARGGKRAAPKVQPKVTGAIPGKPAQEVPRIGRTYASADVFPAVTPNTKLFTPLKRLMAAPEVRAITHPRSVDAEGKPIQTPARLDVAGLKKLSDVIERFNDDDVRDGLRTLDNYNDEVRKPLLERIDSLIDSIENAPKQDVLPGAAPKAVYPGAALSSGTRKGGKFGLATTRKDISDVPIDVRGVYNRAARAPYTYKELVNIARNQMSRQPGLRRRVEAALDEYVRTNFGENAEVKYANGKFYVEREGTAAHVKALDERIAAVNDELIKDAFDGAPDVTTMGIEPFLDPSGTSVHLEALAHSLVGAQLELKDGSYVKVDSLPGWAEDRGIEVGGRWIDVNDIQSVHSTRPDLLPTSKGWELKRSNLELFIRKLLAGKLDDNSLNTLHVDLQSLSDAQLSSIRAALTAIHSEASPTFKSTKDLKSLTASVEQPRGVNINPAIDQTLTVIDEMLDARDNGQAVQSDVRWESARRGLEMREERSAEAHEKSKKSSEDRIQEEVDAWRAANPGKDVPKKVWDDILKRNPMPEDVGMGTGSSEEGVNEEGETTVMPERGRVGSEPLEKRSTQRSGWISREHTRGIAQHALANPDLISGKDPRLIKLIGILHTGYKHGWSQELGAEADTVSKAISQKLERAGRKPEKGYANIPSPDIARLLGGVHEVTPEMKAAREAQLAKEQVNITPDVDPTAPYNVRNVVDRARQWMEKERLKAKGAKFNEMNADIRKLDELRISMQSTRARMDKIAKMPYGKKRDAMMAYEIANANAAEQAAAIMFRKMGESYGLHGIDPKTGKARNRGMATIMARHPEVTQQALLTMAGVKEAPAPETPVKKVNPTGNNLLPHDRLELAHHMFPPPKSATDTGMRVGPDGNMVMDRPMRNDELQLHFTDGTGERFTIAQLKARIAKEGAGFWDNVSKVYASKNAIFNNEGQFIGKGLVDRDKYMERLLIDSNEYIKDTLEEIGYNRKDLDKLSQKQLKELANEHREAFEDGSDGDEDTE